MSTYRNHHMHAEAIEVSFDPEQTSYRDLLEFFFRIHDPTTLNRQGNDIGTSYRSAIFYLDDEQRRVVEETIADVEASGLWPGKVVTEVTPAGPFWEASPSIRTTSSGIRTATPATTFARIGCCHGGRERPPASYRRPYDLGVRAAAAACGRGRSRPLAALPRPRAGTASRSR